MVGERQGRCGLFWILLSCWYGLASPFTPRSDLYSQHRRHAQGLHLPSLRVSQFDIEDELKEEVRSARSPTVPEIEQDHVVRMTFLGTKSVVTAPLLLSEDGVQDLNDFFSVGRHRNLLFFRNDVSALTNPSEDIISRWSTEVALHGGSDILDGSVDGGKKSILRMKAYVKMPGLRVLSETLVGANLILGQQDDNSSFPEYQFTVIDTKLTPEGAAPLVWLFNKLTKYMDKTSSFSRVRPVKAGKGDNRRIVFKTDARLETTIRLPKAAAKVLPINIAKFEQQGSRSMQKLLEKELEPALLCFRDAFMKCYNVLN
mmetsp:Transcript_41961/g.127226  ORF Transcript_41961/g.127226 Transcript_41961/m.127226 type:complete len:315 (-) Transcript_41961:27-971(-)